MKSIIRHGSTPPTSNDLDEYQLGFCNSNNLLYIKNANGEIVPLNDLQSIRNYIDESLSNGSSNKNEFVGTQEEWDALTTEEQNSYDIAYIKKEGNDRTLNEFIGTQEEWDALTAEEQNVYDIAYIKKSEVEESVPNAAIETVKDYTKNYVDAKNSYSTEETLTGGTWIDGKPIYRKAYHFNTMLSVGRDFYTMNVGQADFDTLIKTYYIGRRPNMTDIMSAYFPTWTGENYTGFKISVNDGEAMFVDYIIFEYTKKTD